MKKYWQVIGIAAVGAAVLYYPALKLFQYLKNRNSEGEDANDQHTVRPFFGPAYRGKHKPHHRSTHNGHSNPDMA